MELKKLLLCASLLSPFMSHGAQTESERALSILLSNAVTEINVKGPQILDEETRLDSAATFKNVIIYNNTMLNYAAAQLDVNQFNAIIEEVVLGTLCANKGLQSFIDLGVVMVYRYQGNDGQYITELSKDMASCKQ
tara:strand:- start:1835 stop:2242 length:408 start_codon:yes stop_codon:yes gene_type:complete